MRRKLIKFILATTILAGILSACQKEYDELSGDRSYTVDEARAWYEAHNPGYLELKSGGNERNIKIIKPDWARGMKSENSDEEIIEADILTNGGFGFATEELYSKWEASGNERYMRSHTRLVVLKNKKTKTETGCFMTIIGDRSYMERKNFDTGGNRYRKPENDFSGVILFHYLNGGFSNGWRYTGGQLTHITTISFEELMDNGLKSAFYCKTEPFYYWNVVCTHYYYVTSVDGVVIKKEYSYSTCDPVQVYAGSITNCSEISGGGAPPPVSGGYTGNTSPTQPTLTIPESLKPFVSAMNLTTQSQINKLAQAFEEFKNKNCGNKAIYNKLLNRGTKFNFGMNSNIGGYASYNPIDKSLNFKDESSIIANNLEEELFHAWQDNFYSGGISQYLISPYIGRSNIEIESRVLRELMFSMRNGYFAEYGSESFRSLIISLSDYYRINNKFPSQLSDLQKSFFINSVNDLKVVLPDYNFPTNPTLYPNALMDILSSVSGCLQVE